jgi:hypothetical protein
MEAFWSTLKRKALEESAAWSKDRVRREFLNTLKPSTTGAGSTALCGIDHLWTSNTRTTKNMKRTARTGVHKKGGRKGRLPPNQFRAYFKAIAGCSNRFQARSNHKDQSLELRTLASGEGFLYTPCFKRARRPTHRHRQPFHLQWLSAPLPPTTLQV